MEERYCCNMCGKQIMKKIRFCPYCGEKNVLWGNEDNNEIVMETDTSCVKETTEAYIENRGQNGIVETMNPYIENSFFDEGGNMNIITEDLEKAIWEMWGLQIDRKYLLQLKSVMRENEKIACVIDMQFGDSNTINGYAFCMTNRIIIVGQKEKVSIPISMINDVKKIKGVAYTTTPSELFIGYGNATIHILSCRHKLLSQFADNVIGKAGKMVDMTVEQTEKNAGSAVLKMIGEIIMFIIGLEILQYIVSLLQ